MISSNLDRPPDQMGRRRGFLGVALRSLCGTSIGPVEWPSPLPRLDRRSYQTPSRWRREAQSRPAVADRTSRPIPAAVARHPVTILLVFLMVIRTSVNLQYLRSHNTTSLRPHGSVRRLLDLRHSSQMWVIDEALAKMNAELSIDLPKAKPGRKAA